MKAYLGFIPIAIVGIPYIVASIRQALFYKGCMDGFEYLIAAMFGFMVGGVLNIIFLLYVALAHRTYFIFTDTKKRIAAKTGIIGALLLLLIQLGVLAWIYVEKRNNI